MDKQYTIGKAIDFIEDNLLNEISVNDVVEHVGYSKSYFSKIFSRYTKTSIYDYIIKRRLSESYKDLIITGDVIKDIAKKYCFDSQEVYEKAFERFFGFMPGEINPGLCNLNLYERLDNEYLEFLMRLSVEVVDRNVDKIYFTERVDNTCSFDRIFVLDPEDYRYMSHSIKGVVSNCQMDELSYELVGLTHRINVADRDYFNVFRVFIDHYYNESDLMLNYIVFKENKDNIEVLIPTELVSEK